MYTRRIMECAQALHRFRTILERSVFQGRGKALQLLVNTGSPGVLANVNYHVNVACEYVRAGASWMSGSDFEDEDFDNPTPFEGALSLLEHTTMLARVAADCKPPSSRELRSISFSWAPNRKVSGAFLMSQLVVPHTFFHLAVAHCVLREHGFINTVGYLKPISLINAHSPL